MSARDGVRGTSWGIATPHTLASDAGSGVLEDGGTAVDAAIAAAAVLTVVYPHNCSVGGDLVGVVAPAGQAPQAVFGVGRAAAGIDVAAWRSRFGERVPVSGPLSISVPGVISGWQAMHDLGGKRPFAELLAPAIALATGGFEVGPSLSLALADHDAQDVGLDAIFGAAGGRAGLGDRVVQPELAETLREIAEEPSDYYRGDLARRVAVWLESVGSPLRRSDLAAHAAVVGPPLDAACGPIAPRLWTPGPPSQGVFVMLLARAAGMLRADGYELLGGDADLLARLFHATTVQRDQLLADPRRAGSGLLEAAREGAARRLVGEVLDGRAAADEASAPADIPTRSERAAPSGDTVALAVIDRWGGAVSVLQSVFHSFGSGMLDPGSGIVFHNRQAMFTLRPGAPNELAPGLMPPHTLAPALVSGDGGALRAVLGTMGGRAQPQIVVEVLLRLADGEGCARAVGAPRFVVGELDANGDNGVVLVEPGLDDVATLALTRAGLAVQRLRPHDETVGHAQLLSVGPEQTVSGASDPRSDGAAICGGAETS